MDYVHGYEVRKMQAIMKNAVFAVIGMCAACSAAYGQSDSGTELRSRIHAAESALNAAPEQSDGIVWLQLAILYQDAARYDDAGRAFRKATDLLKTQDRARYAEALDRMGTMYVECGKFAKAESLERKALAIRQDRYDTVGVGRSYMHLSLAAYGKHDLRGAETDAEMAVSVLAPEKAVRIRAEGAAPEEKMSALIDLALIRCAEGECEVASHDLERALLLANANYEANSVPVGFLHFLLGYTRVKSGDLPGGGARMKTGIEEMKREIGWGHPTYVAALKEYRAVLVQEGRNDDASEVEESIAKLERTTSPRSRGAASLLGMNSLR